MIENENKLKMNKIIRKTMLAGLAVAMLVTGCAKSEKSEPNAANQRYLEAWISKYHPEKKPTELGVYLLEDEAGTGTAFTGQNYAIVSYTVTDLAGKVSSTTYKKLAQQLGTYNASYYYGPVTWQAVSSSLPAGVEDMMAGMKVGGTRTAVIPAWLMTYDRYSNPETYMKKSTDESNAIYKITLEGVSDDILKSQIDSMEIYSSRFMEGTDSTSYGFYYQQLKEPADTHSFKSDTTIYINYIGRLLNGQVFDTTIADTAKMYNIYNSSSTYEPVKITWGDTFTDLKMTSGSSSESSSIITGFQKTLWEMRHPYEKGVGMFFSAYGYGTSGSGSTIPGYAPLVFEIEIVDKPEE